MPKKITKKEVRKEVSRPIGMSGLAVGTATEGFCGEDCNCTDTPTKVAISEITESFGNGELNLLKDKINEIIKRIN